MQPSPERVSVAHYALTAPMLSADARLASVSQDGVTAQVLETTAGEQATYRASNQRQPGDFRP